MRRPTARELARLSRLRLTLVAVRRRWGWLGLAAVLLVFGGGFAVAPWAMLARDAGVEHEGERAPATVAALLVEEDADGDAEYAVLYEFEASPGRRVAGRSVATAEAFGALGEGDQIEVAFDPADPRQSFPLDPDLSAGRVRTPGAALLFSAFGLPFVAFGGLIAWGLLVRLPAAWARLLADGHAADGTVVEVEVGAKNPRETRLRYHFVDRFGTLREAETEWVPPEVTAGWREGDTGAVRYGRRDPDESIWLGAGDLAFYR